MKYLVKGDEVATFYSNEETPKVVARWGIGLLEKTDKPFERLHDKKELVDVSIHMEKVLDKLMETKDGFFPLDGTIKYPLIYDECSDEVKTLIDDTFDDDAIRKHYQLNNKEEIYE